MRDESAPITPTALSHEDWLAKWAPPCPDGNPQRLLEILGFRLKGADLLQLRVVLKQDDGGVCQAIVEEHPDRVYVRALACLEEEEEEEKEDWPDSFSQPTEGGNPGWRRPREIDCPCNVWLDAPLDERVVIDVDSDEELPFFIPRWGTGEPSLYVPRPPGPVWSPPEPPLAD